MPPLRVRALDLSCKADVSNVTVAYHFPDGIQEVFGVFYTVIIRVGSGLAVRNRTYRVFGGGQAGYSPLKLTLMTGIMIITVNENLLLLGCFFRFSIPKLLYLRCRFL